MLSQERREEILSNMIYADLKLERGEVSHYHVYKMYKEDVNSLMDEVLRLTDKLNTYQDASCTDEVAQRADEILEKEDLHGYATATEAE